ncbi:hypothetical protein TSAR_005757 [Trichomalopsis sarcophagae]|uniref:Uncharacterized protein n=1 Tax=Trichomalopsis sarcophagae TaxID=543379 RepID=A0A232ESK8_9HYME|nr:hypothetical protein TSAR_005757 [Trichomalopsis sarcophagae]
MGCSIFLPWCVYYFSPHLRRKYHIPSGAPREECAFSVLVLKIVYYVPREQKTWTVHISCKLLPEMKTRVAIFIYDSKNV